MIWLLSAKITFWLEPVSVNSGCARLPPPVPKISLFDFLPPYPPHFLRRIAITSAQVFGSGGALLLGFSGFTNTRSSFMITFIASAIFSSLGRRWPSSSNAQGDHGEAAES